MSIRILKKALGLLIVDIVIIIGIFVLQFRTDSNIIKKIGNLQITLAGAEEQDGDSVYINKLRVSYNGINFYCDDQNPAFVRKNGTEIPVRLIDWEQQDSLSCIIKFTEDVNVTCELASTEPDSSIAVFADLPDDVTSFVIPYNYSSNIKVQKAETNSIILDRKKSLWEFSAHSVVAGFAEFNRHDYVATYAIYDENHKFSFDSIMDLAIASEGEYLKTISAFKKNLISAFDSNQSVDNITEQVAVSYVAAMAENGSYKRALENIPDSVKKNRQRTYLSAPYMNNLEDMNATLEKEMKDYELKIKGSALSASMDIFTIPNIADFMYIQSDSSNVIKLLQAASRADVSELSLAQISGILRVYADLTKYKPSYAEIMVPVLEECIKKITESCNFEGNVLTISENDTFLSVIQAIETGVSLLRYGTIVQDEVLINAGHAIVNSYLSESTSFDLRTLCNLYPIVAYDNPYYPHLEKIRESGNELIWAWTCAKSIECKRDAGEINFTIDFPEGDTHYVIIKGVPQFSSIYIYDMAFRTDPRFETYNSSGYIFKKSTDTLLLKSRHKKRLETVRLIYNTPVPAAETAAPAPAATETKPAPATEATAPAPAVEEAKPAAEPEPHEETPEEAIKRMAAEAAANLGF